MSDFVELERFFNEKKPIKAKTKSELNVNERLEIHAALTHDVRKEILEFISNNSGVSFLEINKVFNLNPVTLAYHLKILTKTGLIISEPEKDAFDLFTKGKSELLKEPNINDVLKHYKYYITNLGKEMLEIKDYTEWVRKGNARN